MTFLGACCKNQQVKQTSKLSICKNFLVRNTLNSTRQNSTQQNRTIRGLALSVFILLVVTIVSSANAQMAIVRTTAGQTGIGQTSIGQANTSQAISGQARVQLELITTSSRLAGAGLQSLAIGSDVGLRISSDRDTYIYLFNYDAEKTLSPLTDSSNNFIRAGSVYNYPSVDSRYKVLGPAGRESILAITSLRPLSHNRLQQLVMQGIQNAQGLAGNYNTTNNNVTNNRALLNGGSSATKPHAAQDGWLADTLIFDVYSANMVQAPSTPAPSTQTPNTPVPDTSSTATNGTLSTSTSGTSNGFKACSLSGLTLAAPNNSVDFNQRCINRSFDSSFENPADMLTIVQHFGNELAKNGFDFQATIKGEPHDFRALFAYRGKTFQMQVEKSNQYYRLELLEFDQQAMN